LQESTVAFLRFKKISDKPKVSMKNQPVCFIVRAALFTVALVAALLIQSVQAQTAYTLSTLTSGNT
jgi:hypothetical protein